ncbi:hypothetical protein HMPREF1544_01460 [Mucor circinelloides 1006PhL]|uniref:K Homology domain-containing protein n=1 Tax=Mucor circinelloides f. circinelloides (strain 1006PhL) TaxID=1220926 RepID=S2K8L2_MUCC1|nr:hypothetical protein HMPREF1544_01460 [Mucor circinelloides 1006PhL]
MAALSFSYAPPISGQYTQYITDDEESSIVSRLQEQCQKIMTARNCQISVMTTKNNTFNNTTSTTTTSNTTNTTNTDVNLSLTGSAQSLMEARGDLLSKCPLEIKLTLQFPPTTNLSQLTEHFEKLEHELTTKISIIPEKLDVSSLVSDNPVYINIVGTPTQVELCRVRVLVVLDEILKSFKTEVVRLPLKLQYLICGRKRAGLLPIIEETSTNIYFPSPFTNAIDATTSHTVENDQDETQPAIYITGEPNHVSRVKDMLNKLAVQKAKSMYHKDTALYARKIDWLLLHRRDELRKIMHDNGAYIEFPPIGSGDNRVTVYAENRVNAERTLRALNFQACNIYEACFYFNNRDGAIYDSTGAHTFFDSTSNLSSLVSQLSQVSGSEVIYKTDPGCVEVLGAERAIRNVYQRLQEMQFLQVFHQYTIFRVESSNEQRDFISGKKNGKINKIMKTSGAKIRFMPFINEYNFIIEVESTSFTKALDGLTLLQEELPAEISFYVPESYHKRIIGVGGKNIQRIMKKYGVYVKFSNTEEFASLGGYYNNQDNVVARTPMKNQINLDNLRHAVMELIHPKDRDYITETIQIPFGLHRDLIHEYQNTFIAEELIKKTNTHVLWPDAELASNTVELLGPEAHMPLAFKMMESIVPEAYDLHISNGGAAFHDAISSNQFQEQVASRLHQEYNVIVETGDSFIRLNMSRGKVLDVLHDALTVVIDYLKSQQVALNEDVINADALFAVVEKKLALSANRKTIMASSNTSSNLLDTTSLLKQHQPHTQSIIGNPPSVSMMRSSSDVVYTAPMGSSSNTHSNSVTPPQAYQFFNFQQHDSMPMDSNWASLNSSHMQQQQQQQPVPSATTTSTSVQSNGSGNDNNIRAIFDAPMDLTEQERVVLSNYRYQRMSMPPGTNFGFPQAVPTTPTNTDIWSTPSQLPTASSSRRSTAGFSTSGMTSPPQARHSVGSSYGSNAGADINLRRYNEGTNNAFYPASMVHSHMSAAPSPATAGSSTVAGEFNPYSDTTSTSGSLKSSKSMPEPMLESHFNAGRSTFHQQQQPPQQQQQQQQQTSPNAFHASHQQGFNQLNLGNYRQSNPGGGFVSRNTPPSHDQFFNSNEEVNVVQSMLGNLTTNDTTTFDPRRQPPSSSTSNNDYDNKNKGSRPPPGIDI